MPVVNKDGCEWYTTTKPVLGRTWQALEFEGSPMNEFFGWAIFTMAHSPHVRLVREFNEPQDSPRRKLPQRHTANHAACLARSVIFTMT